MGKSYIKILVILQAVIFLTSTCSGLIITDVQKHLYGEIQNYSDNEIEQNKVNNDESYRVVIGPIFKGKKDYTKCQFVRDMSKDEAMKFKEEIYSIDNNQQFSDDITIQKKIDVFKKYQILPSDFNLASISENYTKLLNIKNGKKVLNHTSQGMASGK